MESFRTPPTIPCLPAIKTLGIGRVRIAHYEDSEVGGIFQFLQNAAKRGENVGSDEYPSCEAFLEKVLNQMSPGTIITFNDAANGQMRAAAIFHNSAFTRSVSNLFLADMRLVTAPDIWQNPSLLGELLKECLDLLADWPVGFRGVMIECFLTSQVFINAMKGLKFSLTTIIPQVVKHISFGLMDSYVFYKELPVETPARSWKPPPDVPRTEMPAIDIKPVSFLPTVRKLEFSPINALIRSATEADVPILYSFLKQTAAKGQGFTEDEVPSLDLFISRTIDNAYPVVVEDLDRKIMLGFLIISNSAYSRSADCCLADAWSFMNPSIEKRGLGKNLGTLASRVAVQLGYKIVITDTVIDNVRVLMSCTRQGYNATGSVPNGFYSEKKGWQDFIVLCCDLKNQPNLLDLEKVDGNHDAVQELKRSSKL